jgi:sugar phosphate isomerase/epimerase
VNSPALGLNFDISHFAVQGMPLQETVAALAPHAIHTHVKDGRMEGGKVKFLLPGEGGFDYVAYFGAMDKAGWRGCITVEVSGMIFNQPGYDPWKAAEFCWKTLSSARSTALRPRSGP